MPKGFRKATDREKIDALNQVRIWAGQVAIDMKDTVGGDQYVYTGGMNAVDHMRDAIDKANTVLSFGVRI